MTRPAQPAPRSGEDTDVLPRVRGPRHRENRRSRQRRLLAGGRVLAALATVLALMVTGMGWAGYRSLAGGFITSLALDGGPNSTGGEQNILIMGLDSRLDQHGNPLPQAMYEALHAGDESVGGYNANVLILLHLPAGGGPVIAISIPRDDYVDLPGCPSQVCKAKIKQAYGLAYEQAMEELAVQENSESSSSTTVSDSTPANEQAAREAGRKEQIKTVRALLGVPIDHFIEVTLGAFFKIAEVVQPITVCLSDDTADDYSGADFRKGVQQIDAAQALAFVRQRRDLNDALFTDLDRTRRQQAFIVSLMSALRHGGALSSPSALRRLVQVAQQNVAVDAGFDLAGFVDSDSVLSGRPISLYTLPISEFGQDSAGEDVNLIDVSAIRSIVRNLFATGSPDPTPPPAVSAVLDVVNATTQDGLATAVENAWATRGFTQGEVSTADSLADVSTIEFGAGSESAARMLAEQLQLTAEASDQVAPGTVQLTLGSDFPAEDYLSSDGTEIFTAPAETPAAALDPVDATATGADAPAPTDLTRMTGDGIPCVR
ncbi:MAG: LCP family protein [Actinomycetia bacterium]|nr:LCP family protein [Actinomycetes bacterium]